MTPQLSNANLWIFGNFYKIREILTKFKWIFHFPTGQEKWIAKFLKRSTFSLKQKLTLKEVKGFWVDLFIAISLFDFADYRETISTHENVLLSFGQSVQNHVESREVIVNKSIKFSPLKAWPLRGKDRIRFIKYRTEKLVVQTQNVENTNLKSIYSVKHVKKRRKVAQIKCSSCGK